MTFEPAKSPRLSRFPTLLEIMRAAWAGQSVRTRAIAALEQFCGYCSQPMPRIPGCDTVIRIAIHIHRGMTVHEAAAREYRYRWHLFLDAWVNHTETRSRGRFGHGPVIHPAPHPLGL